MTATYRAEKCGHVWLCWDGVLNRHGFMAEKDARLLAERLNREQCKKEG